MPEESTNTGSSFNRDAAGSNPAAAGAQPPAPERKFHGWRLLGIIMIVVLVIAVISAIVDWAIIGPLEDRAW